MNNVDLSKDYYEILGIKSDEPQEGIKPTYRGLAMKYHPDRNPGDKAAEEKFKDVAEAYEVLSSPVNRKAYDDARKAIPTQEDLEDMLKGFDDIFKDADVFAGGFFHSRRKPDPVWNEYDRVKTAAWSECDRRETAAWRVFNNLDTTCWKEYRSVDVSAWRKYSDLNNSLWREYKRNNFSYSEYSRTKSKAYSEYNRTKGAAYSEYNKIKSQAKREYNQIKNKNKKIYYAIERNAKKMYNSKNLDGLKGFTNGDILKMFGKDKQKTKKSWWDIFGF